MCILQCAKSPIWALFCLDQSAPGSSGQVRGRFINLLCRDLYKRFTGEEALSLYLAPLRELLPDESVRNLRLPGLLSITSFLGLCFDLLIQIRPVN